MRRFLIFATEAEALSAERAIFALGAQVAQAQGYTVNDAGIVARRNGQSNPDAARTTGWAVPRQTASGEWAVPHPERHPSAGDPEYATLIAALVASLDCEVADGLDVETQGFAP